MQAATFQHNRAGTNLPVASSSSKVVPSFCIHLSGYTNNVLKHSPTSSKRHPIEFKFAFRALSLSATNRITSKEKSTVVFQ